MTTTALDDRPDLRRGAPPTTVTAPAVEMRPKPAPARFALDANDFWTQVLLVAIGSAVVVAQRADGKRVNVVIYACGAAVVLVAAAVAHLRHRATTERPPRTSTSEAVRAWAVRRAVPAVLVAAPLVALLLGLLGVVAEPVHGYAYLAAAFVALPAFVAWRRARADDEDEPVRLLHRYALYAAIPYVVFTIVRLPAFYVWDFVYWGPWYVFGGAPIGETGTTTSGLVAGACLYSLQGWALSMAYYVLFRRRSLLNALLYLFVFVSSLYSLCSPSC